MRFQAGRHAAIYVRKDMWAGIVEGIVEVEQPDRAVVAKASPLIVAWSELESPSGRRQWSWRNLPGVAEDDFESRRQPAFASHCFIALAYLAPDSRGPSVPSGGFVPPMWCR